MGKFLNFVKQVFGGSNNDEKESQSIKTESVKKIEPVERINTVTASQNTSNSSGNIWDFVREGKELDEHLKKSEYQNMQVSPEKPSLADGVGKYWEVFEKIRKLEREERYEEIVALGYEYLEELEGENNEEEFLAQVSSSEEEFLVQVPFAESDDDDDDFALIDDDDFALIEEPQEEVYDEEREMKQRIMLTCFKIGVLHGNIYALCQIGVAFCQGESLPMNLHIAEKIFLRLRKSGFIEYNELFEEGLLEIRQALEEESRESSSSMNYYAKIYREKADRIETAHYREEEWMLYEYYNMAVYKNCRNGMLMPKFKSKYYSQRINWEQVLAMPWEIYAKQAMQDNF